MSKNKRLDLKDRVRGCLVGTAVGDALGMPVEGMTPQQIQEKFGGVYKYHDSISRFSRGLTAGQWTDDTALSLATAQGLTDAISSNIININDIRTNVFLRYEAALEEHNRGFGKTTRESLEDRARGLDPFDGRHPKRPGNGTAMKSAIIGAFFAATSAIGGFDPTNVVNIVDFISLITHNDSRSRTAAFAQAFVAMFAITNNHGLSDIWMDQQVMFDLLIYHTERFEADLGEDSESPKISEILPKVWELRTASDSVIADTLKTSGTVWESFPTALCFAIKYHNDFRNGITAGANAGGDTDTIAAMTGALLGARLGLKAIPQDLLEDLERFDHIINVADRLCEKIAWQYFESAMKDKDTDLPLCYVKVPWKFV